jgi:hypothetical protein
VSHHAQQSAFLDKSFEMFSALCDIRELFLGLTAIWGNSGHSQPRWDLSLGSVPGRSFIAISLFVGRNLLQGRNYSEVHFADGNSEAKWLPQGHSLCKWQSGD